MKYFTGIKLKEWQHAALGAGDVDVPGALNALKEIGYGGYFNVHIISETDRIVEVARETKRRLDAQLGRGLS